MQIQEISNNKLEREYLINIPAQNIAESIHGKALQMAETVQMDGFRTGKVPVDIIKQRYKEKLVQESIDEVINQTSQKIISENQLKLALRPNASITKFADDTGLEYKVKFELFPNVPAINHEKYSVTEFICDVSDADVEKVIGDLRKAKQQLNKADKKTVTAEGHVVVIDFTGTLNGEEFEGGKAEDHKLELGSGRFIPGFETGLLGLKAGDSTKLKLKFPKDYAATEFANKKVDFHVTIKEVHSASLPELNDEFAQSFSAKDMADLRLQIKAELQKRYSKVAFGFTKKELLDVLDKGISFDLPQTLVENELISLVRQITGQKLEDGVVDDAMRAKYSKIANRRVKLGFLLSETAQNNNLTITQDDMRNAVVNYAQSMPGKEKEVIEYFNKNPQAIEGLKGPVIEEKAVRYILTKTKNKPRHLTIEGLLELVKKSETEEVA